MRRHGGSTSNWLLHVRRVLKRNLSSFLDVLNNKLKKSMRKILLNFFTRKNHQTVEQVFPIVEELQPELLEEDPPLILKNKFGIVERMDGQCVN